MDSTCAIAVAVVHAAERCGAGAGADCIASGRNGRPAQGTPRFHVHVGEAQSLIPDV
jgi:hypothetical protein